jgi:hypothetical protein
MVESLLVEYPNTLILRVRMPIVADLVYPRNFIAKIIKYDKVRAVALPAACRLPPHRVPVGRHTCWLSALRGRCRLAQGMVDPLCVGAPVSNLSWRCYAISWTLSDVGDGLCSSEHVARGICLRRGAAGGWQLLDWHY